MKRSHKSISFVAWKLKLKKYKETYNRARKKNSKEITKDLLLNLYFVKNKSVREIALLLDLGKTTIEHYLKKFDIKNRSKSEASKNAYLKYGNWRSGKTKENSKIIRKSIEKMKNTWKQKEKAKLKIIEVKYGAKIHEVIKNLYWKENLNQEDISQKLGISRLQVIEIMQKYKIDKRPNFEHISSLKGRHHAMFGKNWVDLLGADKAKARKEEYSRRFRNLIIKRLQNRDMPFKDTLIERMISKELAERGIKFVSQYSIEDKFVCDFAIPEFKIAIECDGDYWHANPKFYDQDNLNEIQKLKRKNDQRKDYLLKEKKWKLFRFFESDIKESTSKCVNLVENYIKKVKNPFDGLAANS